MKIQIVISTIAIEFQKKRSPQPQVLIHIKCPIPKLLVFHRYFTSHYSWKKLYLIKPLKKEKLQKCAERGQRAVEKGEYHEHMQKWE